MKRRLETPADIAAECYTKQEGETFAARAKQAFDAKDYHQAKNLYDCARLYDPKHRGYVKGYQDSKALAGEQPFDDRQVML